MSNETAQIASSLDGIKQSDEESAIEFWYARDLMAALGYNNWESFANVVKKAQTACQTAGIPEDNHFRQATKMVSIGSSAMRPIEDVMLSRFACYLVAQNGDPRKTQIAVAQAYFALQTRRAELLDEQIEKLQRLEARDQLRQSEKALSESFATHGIEDSKSYGIIRSKGDQAFFGGFTTQRMKDKFGITSTRPLADFLPTITLAAKTLATEMSKLNIERSDIHGESAITVEHVANNKSVRNMLGERGIKPEELPAEEDISKVARKHVKEQGQLHNSKLPEINND